MNTYNFQRTIPAGETYDLVVAGGGPGGSAAAICAARLGAKVLLLEASGCLGGRGTSGLVSAWSDLADGTEMLVGGLMRELIETMHARGFFKPGIDPDRWRKELHGGMGFNAEGLKLLLDELCIAAGVELRFFTRVIDVDVTGQRMNGVVIHNIEGQRYIQARAFVDATGDAVLADLCGAECRRAGRDTPHIMPPTLCSAQAGIDWKKFDSRGQQDAVFKGVADGFFQPTRPARARTFRAWPDDGDIERRPPFRHGRAGLPQPERRDDPWTAIRLGIRPVLP